MEPVEWGLPAIQIWFFYLLRDWRYIDSQTGYFADFEQFKVDIHFLVVVLGRVFFHLGDKKSGCWSR